VQDVTGPVGFDDFVVARSPRLLRTADLLTHDRTLAEDLLQTALARAREAWRRIEGDPECRCGGSWPTRTPPGGAGAGWASSVAAAGPPPGRLPS
jgi:hypothetical protein